MHPLSKLHVDGFAVLPRALPPAAISALRARALAFASTGAGVREKEAVVFFDLLAPSHEAALRPLMDVPGS